jgi:hypothetical protein
VWAGGAGGRALIRRPCLHAHLKFQDNAENMRGREAAGEGSTGHRTREPRSREGLCSSHAADLGFCGALGGPVKPHKLT